MKKKAAIVVLVSFIMAGVPMMLSGCGVADLFQDVISQAQNLWEEEVSQAEREKDDVWPEQVSGGDSTEEAKATEEPPETQEGTQPSQEAIFTSSSSQQFAYDSLTEGEKVWYRNINRIIGNMQEKQELSESGIEAGLDEGCIDKIFQCVLNDHPEYFYVEGYTYTKFTRGDKLVKIEFSGTYSYSREEAFRRRDLIEAEAGIILSGISQDASDYDKIKYVYETLIRNTGYDLNAPDNQNIYSVFVNKVSVCQGYAKAAQLLLNRLGVECTMVMGTVDTGEGHAWNLVKSRGNYYYVDATWGDASYQMEENIQESAERLPEINYDYLCVTTSQLLRTHTLGGVVPMPQCVSMEDNYYVKEGLYFTEYNEERLGQAFGGAREQGKSDITLKCADQQVYQQLRSSLIDEQDIFTYLDVSEGTVAYAQNDKQLSMTFWMTNQ